MSATTWPCFVLTFAISWIAPLPAVLVHYGVLPGPVDRFMALVGLGAFGPTLAALIMSRREGKGEVSALFARFTIWRVAPYWYLIALGLQSVCLGLGLMLYAIVSQTDIGPWVYPPDTAQRIVGMIVISFAEEVGWRGFALPRLQRRYGPLLASVLLGVLWAFWHVPMLVLANVPLTLLPLLVVFFVAGSVVFTWIFNNTRGSLLLAYLTHVGAHLNNSHAALPSNLTPLLVHTVAYVGLASLVAVFDRTMSVGGERA
jgi:uncharacterized protein